MSHRQASADRLAGRPPSCCCGDGGCSLHFATGYTSVRRLRQGIAGQSAAGLAMRARIVLAAADGGSNVELADRLELDPKHDSQVAQQVRRRSM